MIRKDYLQLEHNHDNQEHHFISNQEYKIALCALHTFVFEADFVHNTFYPINDTWIQEFGWIPSNYEEAFERACAHCREKDVEKFRATFALSELQRAWNRGERKCSMECQLKWEGNTENYTWFYCAVILFGDERGHLKGVIGCGRDRNQRKEREEVVTYQASHDELTDTLNWRAGVRVLDQYMKVDNGKQAAFLLLDIDDFKLLNDTYGHRLGDGVLKRIAKILKDVTTKEACITRYSGDEFVVFLEMDNTEQVRQLLNQMIENVRQQLRVETKNGELQVTTSIGVSLYPKHGKTTERLRACAEHALRYSKLHGKNNYALYDRMMETHEKKTSIIREKDLIKWEEEDDVVYMSNPVTHELYYINRIGRELFGLGNDDYKGRKCYEVLQGLPEPCAFCKKCKLEERGECIKWEHFNKKINRRFLVKDRLIKRDGRMIHVEVAIDITNKEK